MADHEVEFNELLNEYLVPADPFDIDVWTTGDLVKLSNIIDAELQMRYDAAKYIAEGLEDSPTVHTGYGL